MLHSQLLIFLLITCKTLFEVASQEDKPTVKISQGLISGTFEMNELGTFSAFRGIPYAKPPVEELRLKNPEPPVSWYDSLNAAEFKPMCPQQDNYGKFTGEEDCLYLNVYTPIILRDGSTTKNSYPVMVFIHGGNFRRGSSNPYRPETFTENKVVLVTFNYRLGILGFLSTGDESCPGNLGLKDQVLVLKWVKDNIENFGGDPNRITVFGQGAGAASTFLHILSPQSQGLFHQAITQSGSPFCDWTLEENPYAYALEVARQLRCSTKSTSAMIECISQKPINEILYAQENNKTFGDYPLRVTPVIEKDGFLPKNPAEILDSGDFQNIPLLTGINKDDGAIFYTLVNTYRDSLSKNSSFLKTQLIPLFILTATDIRENIEFVSEALMFHYFNGIDSTDVTQVLQPFINMSTDALFLSCNYKTIQLYTEKGALAYMYSFEYKGKYSMLDFEQGVRIGYDGVSHGDELLYLFNLTNDSNPAPKDNLISERLLFLWTTFAQTGKSPSLVSAEYRKWEPYTNEAKNYYEIRGDLLPKTSFKQREVDFWLNHLLELSKIKPVGVNPAIQYRTGNLGWAMLAISIILIIVLVALVYLLYQKSKTQYFETSTELK